MGVDRGSWRHDPERDTFTLVFQRGGRPVYQATFLPFELRYALRNRRATCS